MTDPKTRNHLLSLSVIATSALVLGGAFLVVAAVDQSRPHAPMAPVSIVEATAVPPVAGLVKAPTPARKVVVVRRSRPS